MPLFEPYRPHLDAGEHPPVVGNLSIRTALPSDVMELASIDLHRQLGFVELTRDFTFPGASFEGGVGILFNTELGQRPAPRHP